jgi:hypothetical protein
VVFSAQIFPSCWVTIIRQIASPSPPPERSLLPA